MQGDAAGPAMDHHGKASSPAGQPDNPCKSGMACQASLAAPVLSVTVAVFVAPPAAMHALASDDTAPSLPPDRTLRPPILL